MTTNVLTKAKKGAPVGPHARKARNEVAELVDRIIRANPAIAAAKKPAKEQKAARDELLELLGPTMGPDKEIVAKGRLGMVKFSPCGDALECTDVRALHRELGDAFYDLVSVSVAGLKEALTVRQLRAVTVPCHGPRRMSVLPSEQSVLPGQDVVS